VGGDFGEEGVVVRDASFSRMKSILLFMGANAWARETWFCVREVLMEACL